VDEQRQRRGRRRTREEADGIAAAYEASGLGREEFCEQRGVALKTLARYLTRYRRERSGKDSAAQWMPVEVAAKHRDPALLSVVLEGGRRIEVGRGFDAETLQLLVAVLERV
jgi:hypothetical protein